MNQIAGSRDLAAATGSEVPHHLNDIIGLVTLRSVIIIIVIIITHQYLVPILLYGQIPIDMK